MIQFDPLKALVALSIAITVTGLFLGCLKAGLDMLNEPKKPNKEFK